MQEFSFERLDDAARIILAEINTETEGRPLWYRGISCDRYPLFPKIMRGAERPMAEVFEREARLLARFRERSLPFWGAGYPQTDWEHLFAMQHHGISTRLLDWSENFFVSAFFAANSSPSQDPGHLASHGGEPCKPAIWVLDAYAWNSEVPQLADTGIGILTTVDEEISRWQPQTSSGERLRKRAKMPVAIYGTHNSARIVAQRGTFTLAGEDWRPFEAFCSDNPNLEKCLTKLVCVGDRVRFVGDLSKLGYTESMIYPDLIGLATELDRTEGWPI
ncbi:FRG domain-containing protein [Streptomyces sp. WAC05374]|uniref:FRG domain-containing protein n=1 Tax=Streptomyces sp. WAC05374 TaxID=2487420 RepID=UPI000F8932BD|nr:FRG domain-containing protein [Streptomyces sp. WAC05374]RST11126.1 FRG domain-containing protein [Streptomyces sp. WAC05374]TDF47121.1 FRG domain-containing protein [Streptomyces sp. WAC05374]TDF57379.1 FRG domain-containing protein [Streptomyces sp. WAC05374]TDF61484.1 FRG domain-containing protein [Streptomyces sp. WAC05374]